MSCQDPLSPGDSHVFPHAIAPSHLRLPTTLEPPALGALNEGPDQRESRMKSFLVFSLHNSALFFIGHESDGKYLFFLPLQQEGTG